MKTRAIVVLGILTAIIGLSLSVVTVAWGDTHLPIRHDRPMTGMATMAAPNNGRSQVMAVTLDPTIVYLPVIFKNWPPVVGTDLLINGGFETNSYSSDTGLADWSAWWLEDNCQGDDQFNYACRPNGFYRETLPGGRAFIRSGDSSLTVRNNWDPWVAGAKQTVSAAAGSRVCLTAFGHLWAAGQGWAPNIPSDTWIGAVSSVGLDPNGADYPTLDSQVVWSATASPHDTWTPLSVETTVGASGKVTAILRTSYRGFSTNYLTASWDDAFLRVGSCADNPPPPPLPPPYSSHGIVGNSFTIENATASVNTPVWFDFDVWNTSNATVEYSALAAHTDVGVTAWSWTMQKLKPGQQLIWRDNLKFDTAGTYQVYLGICYAGSVEACQSANWDRLSPNITVTVQE